MTWYNDFKKDNRRAIINLVDSEYLMCSFYENDRTVGEIEYPDKSYYYVKDAAENWIEGIMTDDTVKMYKI